MYHSKVVPVVSLLALAACGSAADPGEIANGVALRATTDTTRPAAAVGSPGTVAPGDPDAGPSAPVVAGGGAVLAPDPGTTRQVDFNNSIIDPMNPRPDARYPEGYGHACAVSSVGTVQCWGNSAGVGPNSSRLGADAPRSVPVSNVRQIAAGDDFTCALRNDGTVACWGANEDRQLGADRDGSEVPQDVPWVVDGAQIDAGSHHVCVVTGGGGVICWGDNSVGQLGLRTTASVPGPQLLPGIVSAAHVATAAQSTCVALKDGTVECWGDNGFGQLGSGSLQPYQTAIPTPVPGLKDVVQLSANGGYVCARTKVALGPLNPYGDPSTVSGGVVSCWGNGNPEMTQWPLASDLTPNPPVAFAGTRPSPIGDAYGNERGFVDVAVGTLHACALTYDGWLGCWGYAQSGDLGDGVSGGGWYRANMDSVIRPGDAPFEQANAVFAGGDNTCATVGADKTLWCWGNPAFDMTANAYDMNKMNVRYYPGTLVVKGEAYPEHAVDLAW